MLIVWYSKHEMCVKWGQSTSSLFTVSRDVRQGGILFPRIFAVPIDDRAKHSDGGKLEYFFIEHQCINHVMYGDDMCVYSLFSS